MITGTGSAVRRLLTIKIVETVYVNRLGAHGTVNRPWTVDLRKMEQNAAAENTPPATVGGCLRLWDNVFPS